MSLRKKKSAKSNRKSKKVGAGAAQSFLSLDKKVWPLERDIFFRPDRMKYVRKLIKPEGCVFCQAAEEKISFDTLCLHQTRHSMVVLNKYPYNSGHILILPKRHCGDMLELSEKEWSDLNTLLRTSMRVIQNLYSPAGFNIGLNHGAVAGAGIPEHLHFHMIPRWAGDLNFFPLVAETKLVVEDLATSYDRLMRAFQSLGESSKLGGIG